MPQEYQLPDRVYKYPFELIMMAYERRFPTCHMIPVFLGSETQYEYKSKDGAIHNIERRCKIDVEAPYLLKKMCGAEFVYFVQKNMLNRRKRILTIEATNETFNSRVRIKEECLYKPHPDNEDWTIFEQKATLNIVSFFGIEQQVEKLGIKAYHKNIKKGKEIIMYYIDELAEQGTTSVPRWSGADEESDSDDSFTSAGDEDEWNKKDYKLDSDYINRYLGDLSPMEECSIIQLAKRLKVSHEKIPDERVLLRFLRARNFNIEKSREMLVKSMAWRKQYNIDPHLGFWTPPDVLSKYLPGCWHKSDKDGRPVYILRLGHLDIKGMLRAVGEEALLRHALYLCEEGIAKTNQSASSKTGSWTLIIDLEGLNLRHLWAPARMAMKRFTEVMESNYPETLGVVLIVQAPRLFPLAWTLVKSFINENTRRKCLVYAGNDYLEEGGIHEYIHREDIPDFLGGPATCDITCNGLVPREEYTLSTEDILERETGMQSLYKSQILKREEVHEITVEADVDAVITWDFDTVLGELTYSLLYRHYNNATAQCASTTTIAAMAEMAGITYLASASPSENYTDKVIEDGSLECIKEGDSIQGSHYVQKAGLYVLQWRNTTLATSSPLLSGRNSTQKSTLIYSIEVIEPQDYVGSVSSLTSSFSNLSSSGASWNSMVSR